MQHSQYHRLHVFEDSSNRMPERQMAPSFDTNKENATVATKASLRPFAPVAQENYTAPSKTVEETILQGFNNFNVSDRRSVPAPVPSFSRPTNTNIHTNTHTFHAPSVETFDFTNVQTLPRREFASSNVSQFAPSAYPLESFLPVESTFVNFSEDQNTSNRPDLALFPEVHHAFADSNMPRIPSDRALPHGSTFFDTNSFYPQQNESLPQEFSVPETRLLPSSSSSSVLFNFVPTSDCFLPEPFCIAEEDTGEPITQTFSSFSSRAVDDDQGATAFSDPNSSLEDIDQNDQDDPLFVTEYVDEIFAYLRKREEGDAIPKMFLELQKDVKPHHRDILIEWMQEVYHSLRLLSETMFLAVYIVDKTLSSKVVSKRKLQLVAVGAFLVAAKYEELWAPPVEDLRFACDFAFQKEEILKMERMLLNTLGFNLGVATPLMFLRRFSKAGGSDSKTHTLGKYLTEMSLTSYQMVHYHASEIAAAAVYLARRMLDIVPVWRTNLRHYTTFSEERVLPIARHLNLIIAREIAKPSPCAIIRKYSSSRLFAVAKIPLVQLD